MSTVNGEQLRLTREYETAGDRSLFQLWTLRRPRQTWDKLTLLGLRDGQNS